MCREQEGGRGGGGEVLEVVVLGCVIESSDVFDVV